MDGVWEMNLFPIKLPTENDAHEDYQKLKEFNPSILIKSGDWFSRSDFDISKSKPIYIDSDRTGLKASDRHHWYARMACDSLTSPSPIRNWYQEKHRLTLENSKFFADNPKTAMALRKYIASQFRPTAALAIYEMFNAKSVYDPCGGWGDRLVAAMAMGIDYHCRDTNPLVLAGDSAMQQSYKYDGKISFEYEPSEKTSPKGAYDLVFTSPPYWKAEKYQGVYLGCEIKQVAGRKTYNFKNVPAWIEAEENKKQIEEQYKLMFEAKMKGLPHANISEDGEELPLPEINYGKSYLLVKEKK